MVKEKAPLGASEFAATLNGDDAHAILRVLKQFSKTVQKERRIALSDESDESESSEDGDSSDEEEIEQPPTKKLKKDEQWKEDSASYHVPFVGTSVAKSDVANVVRGQWPTGLLEAYLIKSPLAIELTSDDLNVTDGKIHKSLIRKKQTKTSRAIQKAYLKALAELVTAVVPLSRLRNEENAEDNDIDMTSESSSSMQGKFLPILLKKRLSDIFSLLNEETGRGRGNKSVLGGCGNLAAPALKVLQNISLVSVTNARLVSRRLDESLNDGVLRCLLRPLPARKEASADTSDGEKVYSKDARVEAINLATALLKMTDSAVNTYICTSGSRERKVKPGILFVAFREGLASKHQGKRSMGSYDDYLEASADMLYSFRTLVLNHPRAVNQKLLYDLLSRDPLQSLCQLVCCAPPLSESNTFHDVLNASDTYAEEIDSLGNAGVESRRLLLPLLSDNSRSPFLASFGHGSHSAKADGQQIVKTLIQLHGAKNGGIQMQDFLVDSIKKTPAFLPALFRLLTFPDSKQIFQFVTSVHFVSALVRLGPSPADCLSMTNESFKTESMDDILIALLPMKFKRQALGKALQSGVALVVLECLKFIKATVDRFHLLKIEGSDQLGWTDQYIDQLSSAFAQWLPDLQIILTVRTRFDALSGRKDCALINDCLNRVLETFAAVLPSVVREVKFDWMKLIPAKTTEFVHAIPLVQRNMLRTFNSIIGVCEIPKHSLLHSYKNILEIMLTAKSKVIHSESRRIAQKLLLPLMQSRWSESSCTASIDYECECWIDSLTIETLPAFCKLLHHVSANSLEAIASIGKAWKCSHHLGSIEFSLLLVASLESIDASQAFSCLVAQVCMKALLFHRNPPMLATLVNFLSIKFVSSGVKFSLDAGLIDFANCLCHFDQNDESDRINLLGKVLDFNLSADDTFLIAFKWFNKESSMGTEELLNAVRSRGASELIAFVRFLINVQVISGGNGDVSKRSWKLLRSLVPKILLSNDYSKDDKNRILEDIDMCKTEDKDFQLLVVSCPFTADLAFTRTKIKDMAASLSLVEKERKGAVLAQDEQRLSLLELSFLGEIVPMNSIVETQLALTGKSETGFLREFIQTAATEGFTEMDFDLSIIRKLFDTWWALSDPTKKTQNSDLVKVGSHFGSILAAIMRKGDTQSAMLIALVAGRPTDALVERCLHEDGLDFLLSVQKCNLFSVGSRLLETLLGKRDKNLNRRWESGLLDDAMLLSLQHYECLHLKENDDKAIGHLITARAKSWLSEFIDGREDLTESEGILKVTLALLESSEFPNEIDSSTKLIDNLAATLEMVELRKHPAAKSLCQLAMMLLVRESTNEIETSGSTTASLQHLASSLLLRSLEWLPRTYKTQETSNGALVDTHSLAKWLLFLLESVEAYDLEALSALRPALFQKVVRSCLKYGLGDSEETPELSAMSLKLVRQLVTQLSDPQCPLSPLKSQFAAAIPTYEIFNMLTSHSKFADVLSSSNKKVDCVKLELVLLMVCCVARSPSGVVMEPGIWESLYTAFDAGLGELDTAIRKLFYACCDLLMESKDVHIPFLDEFRWKSCQGGPRGGINNRWDWFLDALDSNRIRATISHFPLFDTVEVNLGVSGAEEAMSDADDDDSEDSESDQDSHDSDSKKEDKETEVDTEADVANGLLPGTTWKNPHGQDVRYCPAFILPFLLGALESSLPPMDEKKIVSADPKDEGNPGAEREHATDNKQYLPHILMVQKLCDKGALGFCFACLASKCEKIRCYATGILGILLKAFGSAEARALSSWRGRPQLEMLLNSVQRAFVVKRASGASSELVPMLSPLVSTFLARASLSISKPDDPLFLPLNRYFLKNERDHGAFPDMNRLPAFISLFCSASDDPVQSRKERVWALQHVRDGFLDSSCYRLVASCHAPELIMTSFENQRLSQVPNEMKDSEFVLMLNVFIKIVNFGSNRVVSHLVSRLGLLSWLRLWCASWPFNESFPGTKSRIAFCELVACAVRQATRDKRLRTDSLAHEVCGLVQPVVLLGIDDIESEEGRALLVDNACQALDSLKLVLLRLKREEEDLANFDVHPLGVSLDASIKFLKVSETYQMQEKATMALCALPVCLDDDDDLNPASDYCSLLLNSSLLQIQEHGSNKLQSSIIERVLLVVRHTDGCLAADCNALQSLLAIRSSFVVSEEQCVLLNQCLETLVKNSESIDGIEYTVARELIK